MQPRRAAAGARHSRAGVGLQHPCTKGVHQDVARYHNPTCGCAAPTVLMSFATRRAGHEAVLEGACCGQLAGTTAAW